MNFVKLNMKNIKLLTVLFAFFYTACDIVESPYMIEQEKPIVIVDTTDTIDTTAVIEYKRKILLEDYTGHRCGNCPKAHEKLAELIETYGEQIIPMAVHTGFFAWPLGTYTADYQTSVGNELDAYFGNSNAGLPNGMVNRSSITGELILSYTSWTAAVDQILQATPEIHIEITNAYDSTSRALTVSVLTKALTDISKTLKLAVYISEDSITSMQLDYNQDPQDIPNYTHRHVLRGAINSTWGDIIATGNLTVDDETTRIYSYSINNSWNHYHCDVVAFVYDSESLEIIQAEMLNIFE